MSKQSSSSSISTRKLGVSMFPVALKRIGSISKPIFLSKPGPLTYLVGKFKYPMNITSYAPLFSTTVLKFTSITAFSRAFKLFSFIKSLKKS